MINKSYIFLAVILVSFLAGACQKNTEVVAWVDEAPITTSEMNYWMLLKKAEVYRYFYLEYGVNDSDDFWHSEYEGESTINRLKNLALDASKRCKVQQILAYDRGLIDEMNFDVVIAQMVGENSERAQKLSRGEVIYGPKAFTHRTYFAYQFDKMVIALKEKLAHKELKASHEDLELLKPNAEISVEEYEGFLRRQYVDENYEAFIDSIAKSTRVKLNKKIWQSLKI